MIKTNKIELEFSWDDVWHALTSYAIAKKKLPPDCSYLESNDWVQTVYGFKVILEEKK